MGQYKLIFVTRCIIQRNVWYTFELKKKHSQYKMAGKALTLILLTFITKSASQGCGDTQKCVLLSDCPFAKETLEEASKSTNINEKFNLFKSIYELRCKEESEPMVCCEKASFNDYKGFCDINIYPRQMYKGEPLDFEYGKYYLVQKLKSIRTAGNNCCFHIKVGRTVYEFEPNSRKPRLNLRENGRKFKV